MNRPQLLERIWRSMPPQCKATLDDGSKWLLVFCKGGGQVISFDELVATARYTELLHLLPPTRRALTTERAFDTSLLRYSQAKRLGKL